MATTAAFSLGIVGWRGYDKAWWPFMYDCTVSYLEERGLKPSAVVSGGARGADAFAAWFAGVKDMACVEHKPKVEGSGRGAFARAALARNSLIVEDSDLVIAFVHPESRGTWDTIRKAEAAPGVALKVFTLDDLNAEK